MLTTDSSRDITFNQMLELETAYFQARLSRLPSIKYPVPDDLNFNQASLSQWWCRASESEQKERYDLLSKACEIQNQKNQQK